MQPFTPTDNPDKLMQVAVEISYYPLTPDYVAPIVAFIQDLKKTEGLKIATNQMSTQIAGEYDLVMSSLQAAMKKCLTDRWMVIFTRFMT